MNVVEQPENPFTTAVRALSRLYEHATDTKNTALATRVEVATRDLLGWNHDITHTRLDFPPRSEDATKG
jgi:hypothetical protein